jgi:hypothetical protein
MTAQRKVLSIVGSGRSGTTILCNILGAVPGVFGAGKVRWLWERDLVEQRVCGCGLPPLSCPVWGPVVERTLGLSIGELSREDLAVMLQGIVATQHRICSLPNRRQLLTSPSAHRPADTGRVSLTAATVSLLDALLDVTGASVLVDASKRPQEAAVLAAAGVFDHYIVHVVRDPRAVVQSWRRAKALPASTGQAAMAAKRPSKTVLRWMENAAGSEVLKRSVDPRRWLSIRYEEFAERPRETVQRILDLVGAAGPPPFLSDDTVLLGENHNLSGNPSRFTTGEVRIAPDDRWIVEMPRYDQAAVATATLPFLLRYGYPLLARRAAVPPAVHVGRPA